MHGGYCPTAKIVVELSMVNICLIFERGGCDMDTSSIRKTTFGGFNREDVVEYISKISTKNKEQLAELREENEKLEEELGSTQALLALLREQSEETQAQYDELKEKSEAETSELERLRAELSQALSEKERLADELAVQRANVDKLTRTVGELRPIAEEYAEVKERIADIEISARSRVERLERDTRENLAALLAKSREECNSVLSIAGDVCVQTCEALRRAERDLSGIPGKFDELRLALERLSCGNEVNASAARGEDMK